LVAKKGNAKEIFKLDVMLIKIVVIPLLAAFYIAVQTNYVAIWMTLLC